MKKIIIICIILFSLVLNCCQKRVFVFVRFKGRIVHFFTKEPLSLEVHVNADDALSSKNSTENTIFICGGKSNTNGFFDIKGKASTRGGYYLWVDGRTYIFEDGDRDLTKKDVGEITFGSQSITTKLTLHKISNSSLDFYNDAVVFNSYNDTSIIKNSVIDYQSFRKSQTLDFSYRVNTSGIYSYSVVSVPITSAALTATISY